MRKSPFTRLKRHAEKLDLYERAQLFLSSVYYWDEEMIDMAINDCSDPEAVELHRHLDALIYIASSVVIRMIAYECNLYLSLVVEYRSDICQPDPNAADSKKPFDRQWWVDESAAIWYAFCDFCEDFDCSPYKVLELAPIARHPHTPTRQPIERQVTLFEQWRETDPGYPGPEKIRGWHKALRKIYLTCLDQSTSI